METVTIQTTYGTVRGIQREECQVFKGIRYATAGRFQNPVLYQAAEDGQMASDQEKGNPEAVYQATEFGHICPQNGQEPGSFYDREFWRYKEYQPEPDEDCLYLNIWRPAGAGTVSQAGSVSLAAPSDPVTLPPYPVAVWIHGGAYRSGYGSKIEIDGEYWAKQGIILVSINYRVGILGFLCHEMLEERYGYCGNYGIKDQLCALEWVRTHIASFGGDPEHITVMGQSAGAMSVQTLISSPLLPKGIVGAVMQSGGGYESLSENRTQEEEKKRHAGVLEEMGIRTVEELLEMDIRELIERAGAYEQNHPQQGLLFLPVIQTDLLPEGYEALVDDGRVRDIPCLIGCTKHDITVGKGMEVTDSMLYQGCIKWALHIEEAGHVPSYVYVFCRELLGGEGQGAFHSGDLWYSFRTLERSWREKEKIDYQIAEEMNERWAQFIRTGSPNGDGLAEWRPYTKQNPEVKRFG